MEKADHTLLGGVEEGCSHGVVLTVCTEELEGRERAQWEG
jgi:hypothetical protein